MVLWLRINGDEHPFDATGHFPVLAGYNASGREMYIARIWVDNHDVPSVFTYVVDGARNVSFLGRDGRRRTARRFDVLVLRHDPLDVGVLEIPEGAKLQTGPVYWIREDEDDDSDSDAYSEASSDSYFENWPAGPGLDDDSCSTLPEEAQSRRMEDSTEALARVEKLELEAQEGPTMADIKVSASAEHTMAGPKG